MEIVSNMSHTLLLCFPISYDFGDKMSVFY